MRGAENAVRYAADPVGRGACALPDRARVLAVDIAEDAPEGAEAMPTRLEGDLGDREVAVAQQRRGSLDTPREQVAVRWDAESFLE